MTCGEGPALCRRPALWGGAPPMRPEQADDLLTWMILGVILGGRLGYVLFYQPGYFAANHTTFWGAKLG